MKKFFGLDFGTTNSVLSFNNGSCVEIINIDYCSKTLRSLLYFDENGGIFFGHEAIEKYIDNDASGRFMQSIKTFLPSKQFEYTYINKKKYLLEDLIALILRQIKKKGESHVGDIVDSVVLGRPVVFSEDLEKDKLAENRLRRAAEKAGFKNVQFQLEPIAAALAFEKTLILGEKKKVFIADFGGGTSDFAIINAKGGVAHGYNRRVDVLSVGGVYIGGDTFDSQIMWNKIAKYFGKNVKYRSMTNQVMDISTIITANLRNWHLISQLREVSIREYIRQIKQTADDKQSLSNLESLIDDNYGFLLFQAIEKAKINLSSKEETSIYFKRGDLFINESMTKIELSNMIHLDVIKIEQCAKDVLLRAGLSSEDIDVVFITGGSSHLSCVRKVFIKMFGEGKLKQMDAFTTVAYGLGVKT